MPSVMICLYPSPFVTDALTAIRPEEEAVESPSFPAYDEGDASAYLADYRPVYPWDMHLTLLHFSDFPLEKLSELLAAVRTVAAQTPTVTGRVAGSAEFGFGDSGYPVVALVDSLDLIPLRQRLLEALPADVQPSMSHGFIPHITLAYAWLQDAVEFDVPLDMEMFFKELTVVVGYDGDRVNVPFASSVSSKTTDQGEIVDAEKSSPQSSDILQRVTTEGKKVQVTIKSTVWSSDYINALPDSAFLYVAPGGVVVDHKTVPSSLRHFPFRDVSGEIDRPHLEVAIKRLESAKNVPGLAETNKTAVIDYATSLLEDGESRTKEGRRLSTAMRSKFSEAVSVLKDLLKWADYDDEGKENEEGEMDEKASGTFMVVKTEDGTDRWISFSSNAFEDREREIVATKALEDAIVLADATGERGPLMLWHTKGTEIGVCDFQGMEGRFLIESGTFLDTAMAHAAKKAFEESPVPLGVSIGFSHPKTQPDADGVFTNIKIIERSVCPLDRAANPFTGFQTLKGGDMDDERRAWFKTILGEDRADAILARADTATKELEPLFAHKALAQKAEDEAAAAAAAAATASADGAAGDPPADGAPPADAPTDAPASETDKTAELLTGIVDIINTAIAPVVEAVKASDQVIEGLTEEVKTLKAQLAEVQTSKTAPRLAAMHRATESDDNVADADKVKSLLSANGAPPAPAANPVAPYLADILGARGA